MRVDLTDEFDSPAVRAKLDLLLLFAGTAKQCLPSLHAQAPKNYRVFLQLIADAVKEAIATQGTPATVDEVWVSICGAQKFQRLPAEDKASMMSIFDGPLKENAQEFDYALSYLHRANERAVEWIKELGVVVAVYGETQSLQNVSPRRVKVTFDGELKSACAKGSRAGSICWSLQPHSFAFFGAMLAELVLVHEYLCHVLPANRQLEGEVREVWLNDCIQYGMRNVADPDGTRQAVKFIWLLFLAQYEDHFKGEAYGMYASLSMDYLTRALSGRPLFWRITLAILEGPDGPQFASTVSLLFNDLSRRSDMQYDHLGLLKWGKLEELLAASSAYNSMT